MVAGPILAAPPDVSPFPIMRPDPNAPTPVSRVVVDVIEEPAPVAETPDISSRSPEIEDDTPPSELAVSTSPFPTIRGEVPAVFAARAARLRAIAEAEEAARRQTAEGFRDWLLDFRDRALEEGIERATFNAAFDGVELDQQILDLDRNQAEFSRALWDYLDRAVSPTRVRNGTEMLDEWRTTLGNIEERFQVEAEVVVAIWGLESAYGAARGNANVIEAMATLAYEGRRQAYFETELLAALSILQDGQTEPENMRGSWAGAMGHTQFMPTSYLEYAQDYRDDGIRDIWSDNPQDALASTAHYLAEHGWTYGQPWGLEVQLPEGFDYRLAGEQERITAGFWNGVGVRLVNGDPVPDHGPASILLPAGAQGVALVVYNNFRVIERYNPADAYVIAVGHLSDRITGDEAFRADWPRGDRALQFAERQEMQEYLQALGHYEGNIDGLVGPVTIAASRAFQVEQGLLPDGYASTSLLDRLRNG